MTREFFTAETQDVRKNVAPASSRHRSYDFFSRPQKAEKEEGCDFLRVSAVRSLEFSLQAAVNPGRLKPELRRIRAG
ncbi:MAG: hypothetical protein DMG08_26175 [Acidobacteria bacterium]|nr:MAG: hypothetical protein DMG08_26175 [Acidobacteriota bacterium]